MRYFGISRKKLNNRGSSLIAVIVCVALIGTLGMTMLMMALLNFQMKTVDKQSKANFYDAESAVNEICTGLEAVSEAKMNEALTYVETYYSATPEQLRTTFRNRKYMDFFSAELKTKAKLPDTEASSVAETVYTDTLTTQEEKDFCEYLKNFVTGGDAVKVAAADGTSMQILYDKEKHYVTIENLAVTYTDEKNYETTVSTDVTFQPPENSFSVVQSSNTDLLDGYAIIADDGVETTNGGTGTITGDVYGGSGITAREKLEITASTVVSRGDLKTIDGNILTINPPAGKTTAEVWVNNIITDVSAGIAGATERAVKTNSGDTISIKGNCYVADDLLLNKAGYNVTIDGSYYGYHTGQMFAEKYDGSAVAMNAPYANLDLASGDDQVLWIAGLNTLDVIENSSEGTAKNVYEGESLTYKWTQDAYIIPGSCVRGGSGQNPMPADEYEKLLKSNDVASKGAINMLDFSQYPFIAQINVETYLNPEQPYIAKYVQRYTGDGAESYVYLYMNFISNESASSYFYNYSSYLTQRRAMAAAADMLGYGKVKLNKAATSAVDMFLKDNTETTDEGLQESGSGTSTDGAITDNNVYAGNILTYDSEGTSSAGGTQTGNTSASGNRYEYNVTEDSTNPSETDPFAAADGTANAAGDSSSGSSSSDNSTSSELDTGYGVIKVAESKTSASMLGREGTYFNQYNGLIGVLNKEASSGYPTYNLVSYLYEEKGLTEKMNIIYVPNQEEGTLGANETYSYQDAEDLKVDGTGDSKTITINAGSDGGKNTFKRGIIIADCDVTVIGNFTGKILTKGKITLKNATVKGDRSMSLSNITTENVRDQSQTKTSVTFSNWKKN